MTSHAPLQPTRAPPKSAHRPRGNRKLSPAQHHIHEAKALSVEIERKFLVVGDAWRVIEGTPIHQAYLSLDEQRDVRGTPAPILAR